MTLQKLQNDMISAMKSKDKLRKDVLSSLISAAKKTAIDNRTKDEVSEELVDKTILKEKKLLQEMIDTCPDTRQDLLDEYTAKMVVMNEYAPQLITDENQIKEMITGIALENSIDLSKKNKGQIMRLVSQVLRGKVDMKVANQIVNLLLQ